MVGVAGALGWPRTASAIAVAACVLLSLAGVRGEQPAPDNLAASDVHTPEEVVTNHWHVILNQDGDEKLGREIASRNGYVFVRQMPGEPREYHFMHQAVPHLRMKREVQQTRKLQSDPAVARAIQQSGFRRLKRGFRDLPALVRSRRGVPIAEPHANSRKPQSEPNDPLFGEQWYIRNTGQAGGVEGLDLNVEAAWALNITGKGITTAIMDDGIDYLHPDLRNNFNAEASYDFSSNDQFPYPRYTDDWFNSHGTRCAGEIAAAANNGICGVGVAHGSLVAGLRMLDQPYMTDLIEAAAMSHKPDLIHIYSASWGPTDDGQTVDGPRNATMRKLVDGVNKGRNGKGSIYVWASGDGGPDDDCNCDGYAASMWTISINSATNNGQTASYDESCSSTLASTFSNGKGAYQDAGVATVDLYGRCTTRHSGTSAAAPEAAGVYALALEANAELTWRDVQHLTVLTSKRNHLYDSHSRHNWTMNGAGLEFNHLFGFGVLDAGDMVDLAKNWKPLPERYHCTAGTISGKHRVERGQKLTLTITTDSCRGTPNEVSYIEHVQAFITLRATRRGAVTMFLTSPMNTTSMILGPRPKDADNTRGFTKWPFMATHMWAENPRGTWKLQVQLDSESPAAARGELEVVLSEFTLMIHGTKLQPYADQATGARHKKLALVKREHRAWNV